MKRFLAILTLFLFSMAWCIAGANETVFVEAESFDDKGGWIVDQQYMDVMGSPVLLAHGIGMPVADATTRISFPVPGAYHVFVRTRNWVAPWKPQYAPGRFQLSVDGKKIETVFGTEGASWHWQRGGTVEIANGNVKLELHDLTGFDGRLDAIIFTTDGNFTPPEEIHEIDTIRRKSLKLADSPLDAPDAKEGPFDLVVVGGGISGICAAIAAARLDCKVALIQDRPYLGGNNSSEVRVHLHGRMGYEPYPNLGNLVHQLDPGQDGNAQPGEVYKDWKKLELVSAEKNISLYLNTHVIVAETKKNADDSIEIESVVGKNIESGVETKFRAKLFADCTGDGNLGFMVGADWRMGRESRAETGESMAPEAADGMTMGASILWYSSTVRDEQGNPVKSEFPELPWAHQFTHESVQPALHGDWDWETGLNWDQVSDVERIRDNGLLAAFGHWAYMKNRSEPKWREKAECRKIAWISFLAGKRESRRLMGDVVLKEQDLIERREWPDACVVTTWPIDLHFPEPKHSRHFPGTEFRSIARHKTVFPYAIPYRTLYSRNVSNLFMAGRCISVTHVALGTVRVMRTCGMMGEVVGMAAAVAKEHGTTPRGVYEKHLAELKERMKTGVAPIPGKLWHTARPRTGIVTPPDWLAKAGKNYALAARVAVSSEHPDGDGPAANVNDGRCDMESNESRWVSEKSKDLAENPHWVSLTFDKPVEIDAVRILSGQKGGLTPIRHFVLQQRVDDRWHDIEGTMTEGNGEPDIGIRFKPVKSDAYRLAVYGAPGGMARIWELELYHVGE